jgi:hypothetical protein
VRVVSVAWKLSTIEEQCQDKVACFDEESTETKATTPKKCPGFILVRMLL